MEAGAMTETALRTGTTPSGPQSVEDAVRTIAGLQRQWIFLWDRKEGDPNFDFDTLFADYYDFEDPHGDVILFDDFDPERRVLRSAADFGRTFGPPFNEMRAAEHAIEEAPEVLVSGDLAATRMVFIAKLTDAAGRVMGNRAVSSQVWRRSGDGRWRIVRDQTAVVSIPVEEASRAMDTMPRS
jgi:ketosteroid isomerase-like protein